MSSQSLNSQFRQQQQLYRSAHFLTKPKAPTFYSPPYTPLFNYDELTGHKRRASSEDEEMDNNEPIEEKTPDKKEETISHTTKRSRLILKNEFPITKLLVTLDKDKLIELINNLVDSNPHLKNELDAFTDNP
ncbi:hypothetical protein BDB01DRAFT_854838 [Pilobolus umbonatus]|nr:hypothetical protein BDB01DRAFT_854838 [Pilobolus umbonatus]